MAKAVMDKLQFHYSTSIFYNQKPMFWNPRMSWKNKWKNGDEKQGEKFWGSSRWFVMFTDAWHLFQFFANCSLMLAIVMYKPIIVWYVDFLIIYTIYTTVFEVTFKHILKRKS